MVKLVTWRQKQKRDMTNIHTQAASSAAGPVAASEPEPDAGAAVSTSNVLQTAALSEAQQQLGLSVEYSQQQVQQVAGHHK